MTVRKFQLIAALIAISLAIVAAAFAHSRSDSIQTRVSGKTLAPRDGSHTTNAANDGTFAAAGTTTGSQWIRSAYPKQASAQQVSGDPASYRWALLIGINHYAGGTESNVGSKQDAQSLNSYLHMKMHWRADHILLLTELNATATHIQQAMQWLASKTTNDSVVVFHYAGHENWTSRNVDGDGEGRNVAIWAADNRLIYDGTVGTLLGRVRAKQMWIHFATCRAGGFDDAGMRKTGRIITYSSPESELSYEDPDLHHSVFGWYTIVQGMLNKHADSNHDGKVAVEEAFRYAKNRTTAYTSRRQHPLVADYNGGGNMYLTIPAKPKSSSGSGSSPAPSSSSGVCVFVCL
jgi:hypothetical protein